MNRVIQFLFKTNSGRFVLLILIALGVAYAARIALIDMPAQAKKAAADVGSATLSTMSDRLDEMDEAQRGALPDLTEWSPASVPCGLSIKPPPAAEPWTQLGLDTTVASEFQYRFQKMEKGSITIYARRDSDCDGFYAIWMLEWSPGALGREITAQNILE